MTTIKEAFQAGIAVGRNIMKMEMDAVAQFDTVGFAPAIVARPAPPAIASATANGARKRPGRPVRAAKAPAKAPKTPVVSRGVKMARGPKAKGVKQAIMALIAGGQGITTNDIVAKLGFKATSVNATLASLKKAGLAMQKDRLWRLPGNIDGDSGMHDGEGHSQADDSAAFYGA